MEERAASWRLEGTLVAVARDEIVGWLRVERSSFGYGEIGLLVAVPRGCTSSRYDGV